MVIDNARLSWIQGATENKSSQSTYMPLGHVALQGDSYRKQSTLTQATSAHKEKAIFLKQRFFSTLSHSKSSQRTNENGTYIIHCYQPSIYILHV